MKTYREWLCAIVFLAGALLSASAAEQIAVVTGDRVNVRGRPSLVGEVVIQLNQGEQVVVLEQIPVAKPQPGEPTRWMRIRLPANTPVWVFAPYIDPDEGTSRVNRLNLRAGPGENFSVLGQIERGTPVQRIRVVGNWMEIEALDTTHAFVAADFLQIVETATPDQTSEAPELAASPTPEDPAQPQTIPAPDEEESAPTPVEVDPETPIAAAPGAEPRPTEPRPTEAPPTEAFPIDTDPMATQPVEEALAPEELPRRVVSREGRVIISRSIQAPTEYALESLQTRRTINYIHSEDLGVNLKVYAGRKVIVTGEELIDRRWTNTPIVEVESIRLIP
jgi:uncharacterized protein YgiM (DUF1202 family)